MIEYCDLVAISLPIFNDWQSGGAPFFKNRNVPPILPPCCIRFVSDREWRFLSNSNMAVTGIQCASVYLMSNLYLANPCSFGRGNG